MSRRETGVLPGARSGLVADMADMADMADRARRREPRQGHRRPRCTGLRGPAAILVVLMLAGACGSDDGGGPASGAEGTEGTVTGSITVLAAASLTDVFAEIGDAFEAAHPEASVTFSFGPSSGLVTQVTEGAPADVIATASTSVMDELVATDALDGAPVPFATNALEIAVPPGNLGRVVGLADLADDDLVVALCAPEVPCGTFARQALDRAGIEPSIDSNEQDVRALLTKVEAGEVDAGVVYRTDVVAAGDAVEGIEIPADEVVVASYPIAIPDQSDQVATARAFIDFVLAPEGQSLLARASFGPP